MEAELAIAYLRTNPEVMPEEVLRTFSRWNVRQAEFWSSIMKMTRAEITGKDYFEL